MVGSGPDVVPVHGTPTRSQVWQGVIARLRERYRIHYLDLPGYGESEQFEGQGWGAGRQACPWHRATLNR